MRARRTTVFSYSELKTSNLININIDKNRLNEIQPINQYNKSIDNLDDELLDTEENKEEITFPDDKSSFSLISY